ncbi:MAG: hypothetical protein QF842_06565 [Candidatus Marinimicrobia bacterium]|jgi:hypothetical protein|nr:hypothetical protein [Candidatus Neomarinimicrobiota bacterium]MDP6610815.1 hypothetical protein [Candidatus Neomarinimicrobiota bacterium]|tara:strand:- start:13913 stop:14302 length:390 start_codon:yes stop_codon:yes gene_type:complete
MINIRIIHFLLMIMFLSLGFSQGMAPGKRPEQVDWVKKLDLSEDQAKKMTEINERFRVEMMGIREHASGDRMAIRGLLQDKIGEREKAIKELLSKKQYKQYQKEIKHLRANRRQMGGMGRREDDSRKRN